MLHLNDIPLVTFYRYGNYYDIFQMIIMHLNPLNLILKYMILNFNLFTEVAIEVQKYLNTRIYDFNPPNLNENYQLRLLCFITNTTETDKEVLRKRLIPTKEELRRNSELNQQA